jgi:hypothetical protein
MVQIHLDCAQNFLCCGVHQKILLMDDGQIDKICEGFEVLQLKSSMVDGLIEELSSTKRRL